MDELNEPPVIHEVEDELPLPSFFEVFGCVSSKKKRKFLKSDSSVRASASVSTGETG